MFAAMRANHYFVNDLSTELISLYNNISSQNAKFFNYVDKIDDTWENAHKFFNNNLSLVDLYIKYRQDLISKETLKKEILAFSNERTVQILNIIGNTFDVSCGVLISEMVKKFLHDTNPQEDDFVFLDTPYDSEFSTYAQNEFTHEDQHRLADLMINKCKAKWMMIIKYTDFIYNLYNHDGINIRTFDKEYIVSFMNRNDKKVTHLLITNY